jgi:hypothetical protein
MKQPYQRCGGLAASFDVANPNNVEERSLLTQPAGRQSRLLRRQRFPCHEAMAMASGWASRTPRRRGARAGPAVAARRADDGPLG